MRIITTTLIILITQIKFLCGQESFNNDLLLLEERIFSSQPGVELNKYCLQKFDLYVANNNYSADCLREAKRVSYELIADSTTRLHFLWNSAIIAQINDDRASASYYLKTYTSISSDTSIQTYLLSAMINNGFDSVQVSGAVSKLSSNNKKFESLFCMNKIYDYEIKNKNGYAIASALIPGLGSALNGNIGKGITSLAINSISAYVIYLFVQNNLYLNAVLWGSALGLKFYMGNIKLTTTLVEEKEALKKNTLAKDCKCVLDKLLVEYPIDFK